MLRVPSLFLATIAAAILAPTLGLAETPKRGGILSFAAVAETAAYDCHASQTFALLHPVTPQYSLLVRWDATEKSKIVGDLAKSWTIAPDGLEIVAAEEEDHFLTAVSIEIALVHQLQARREAGCFILAPHLTRKDPKISIQAAE